MKALSPGTAMVRVETGGIVNSCSFLVVDEIDDRDREAAAAHQGKKELWAVAPEDAVYTGSPVKPVPRQRKGAVHIPAALRGVL